MIWLSSLLLLQLLHHAKAPPPRMTTQPSQGDTDQVPLPTWDHYLKQVSKITINDENSEYRDFIHNLNKEIGTGEPEEVEGKEWTAKVIDAFNRLVSENTKRQLHAVKKREIDAIRRRLIPRKKSQTSEDDTPTHLDMKTLSFTAEDLRLLIEANREHVKWVKINNKSC